MGLTLDRIFVEHVLKTKPCLRELEQCAPSQLQARIKDATSRIERFVSAQTDALNVGATTNTDANPSSSEICDWESVHFGRLKQTGRQPTYGFLATPDGKEIFLHRSSLPKETWSLLQEGIYVKFKIQPGAKGPTATDVQPTAWVPS
jgi:cold shock protein